MKKLSQILLAASLLLNALVTPSYASDNSRHKHHDKNHHAKKELKTQKVDQQEPAVQN